ICFHSENFQALQLMHERYREQVKCIYIDPPYNASATEILYKNEYKHSSWLSFILDRLALARPITELCGVMCATVDDYELANLQKALDATWGVDNYLATVVIRNNPSGRSTVKGFAVNHEYGLFYARSSADASVGRLLHT